MISSIMIIPTGNEIAEGVVIDTDSAAVMSALLTLNNNFRILRVAPVCDKETAIMATVSEGIAQGYDLLVFIGGSGGGHRYVPTLTEDYTHSALEKVLDEKSISEIYGKNGHLWCRLVCGRVGKTLVINVPGPYVEAKAAIDAFVKAYKEDKDNLKFINQEMINAVEKKYSHY